MDKPLPSNVQAEQAVLGSLIQDRGAIVAVAAWLFAEHFSLDRHRWIYEAATACYQKRTPPDLVNIADELRRAGRLEGVGGSEYLVDLSNSVPTATHVEYYGRIVERTGVARRIIQAGAKIAQLAYQEGREIEDVAADCQTLLSGAIKRVGAGGLKPLSVFVDEVYNGIVNGAPPGISTGLVDLDTNTKGLQPKRLYMVAGRPGHGKSALAGQIALNIAKAGGRVQIFSLEMGGEDWARRYLSTRTGIDSQRIEAHELAPDDLAPFMDACGDISLLPIAIDDTPGLSMNEIRLRSLQDSAEHGPPALVVIDHLLLVARPGKRGGSDDDPEAVDAIAQAAHNLAKDVQSPVLLVHQLNRGSDHRDSEHFSMADLYKGGEKAAHFIGILDRPELRDPETDKIGLANLHVVKHRGGPTGVICFRFFKTTTHFASLERYRAPEGY